MPTMAIVSIHLSGSFRVSHFEALHCVSARVDKNVAIEAQAFCPAPNRAETPGFLLTLPQFTVYTPPFLEHAGNRIIDLRCETLPTDGWAPESYDFLPTASLASFPPAEQTTHISADVRLHLLLYWPIDHPIGLLDFGEVLAL